MARFQISHSELHYMMQKNKNRKTEDILDMIDKKYGIKKDGILFPKIKSKIEQFVSKYNSRFQKLSRRYDLIKDIDWIKNGSIEVGCDSIPRKKRELKDLASCSDKTKKRRSYDLLNKISEDLIMYTADRLQKRQENKTNSSENDKAALAFFIDMKFTVDQWRKLRAYSKKYNNYFPIYDRIMKEKKKCYPENIEVTDKSASIKL